MNEPTTPASMRLAQILLEENGHLESFEVGMLSRSEFEPIQACFLKLGCELQDVDNRKLTFTVRAPALAN